MTKEEQRQARQARRELTTRTAKLPLRANAGGGGGSNLGWSLADTYEELPSGVSQTRLGRVTGEVNQGQCYLRDAANEHWVWFGPVGTVEALPAIPTYGSQMVYWTSAGDGDGDDQVWMAFAGQTAWTPMQKFTTKSGVPV